jgi:hypothetical protein
VGIRVGQAKKWKASIRAKLPSGMRPPIGRWLEDHGITLEGTTRAPRDPTKPHQPVIMHTTEYNSGMDYTSGTVGPPPPPPPPAGADCSVRVNWPMDRCACCNDDVYSATDPLLACEGCQVVVHQVLPPPLYLLGSLPQQRFLNLAVQAPSSSPMLPTCVGRCPPTTRLSLPRPTSVGCVTSEHDAKLGFSGRAFAPPL